jgi:hypothetical protein
VEESDTKLTFFLNAREELLERIKLRDQALLFYVSGVGAYFAFMVVRHFDPKSDDLLNLYLCFPVPVFCLVCTLIVLQHHTVIGDIAAYTRELYPPELELRHWNTSRVFIERARQGAGDFRFWSQMLTLFVPNLYVVMYSLQQLPGPLKKVSELSVWGSPQHRIALGITVFDIAIATTILVLHLVVRARRKSILALNKNEE